MALLVWVTPLSRTMLTLTLGTVTVSPTTKIWFLTYQCTSDSLTSVESGINQLTTCMCSRVTAMKTVIAVINGVSQMLMTTCITLGFLLVAVVITAMRFINIESECLTARRVSTVVDTEWLFSPSPCTSILSEIVRDGEIFSLGFSSCGSCDVV
mmetsp:Transcript_11852/g.19303  ORF Transcript_11852/g.19303 Transcript_11852/m.19303 type:complete len:154 (+) Transcript_11852:528-989(+)